jgi:hypothetical protein
MQNMRKLLSQNPMTFNELLDLFEAYVSTIGAPINKGHAMLREVLGEGENTALGHVFGVACDADDMARRLQEIRAARNSGTDIKITLSHHDAVRLEYAISEIDRVFSQAAAVIELLHDRAKSDDANEDNKAMAVMAITSRAMMDVDEREGASMRHFAKRLKQDVERIQLHQGEPA